MGVLKTLTDLARLGCADGPEGQAAQNRFFHSLKKYVRQNGLDFEIVKVVAEGPKAAPKTSGKRQTTPPPGPSPTQARAASVVQIPCMLCGAPAAHFEHYYESYRAWCEPHTPWSGHYEFCNRQRPCSDDAESFLKKYHAAQAAKARGSSTIEQAQAIAQAFRPVVGDILMHGAGKVTLADVVNAAGRVAFPKAGKKGRR